jgi:hypothetical protein
MDIRRLYIYLKGDHASCSANVDVILQISPDGTNWHDLETITIALSGTAQVSIAGSCVSLDLSDVAYLRLARAHNYETTVGYTASLNAWISGIKVR